MSTILDTDRSQNFIRLKWTHLYISPLVYKNLMVVQEASYFDRLLCFINGPLILFIAIFGLILNINTIIILAQKVVGKEPGGSRVVTLLTKQFVLISKMGSKDSLLGKVCNFITPKRRRPRIYIYFLWLTCIDTVLLISSFFMYSVPILFNCYNSLYAYLIPFW